MMWVLSDCGFVLVFVVVNMSLSICEIMDGCRGDIFEMEDLMTRGNFAQMVLFQYFDRE